VKKSPPKRTKALKKYFDGRDWSFIDDEVSILYCFDFRGFSHRVLDSRICLTSDGPNKFVRFPTRCHCIKPNMPVMAAHMFLVAHYPLLFYVSYQDNVFKYYWK